MSLLSQAGTLRKWIPKSGLSITDQGVASGANFILNILLARWLTPSGYGGFAVAFAVFLFLSGFHNALILEPLSVIGPSRYKQNLHEYIKSTLKIYAGLTLGLAALVFLLALIFSQLNEHIASSLLGLAVSQPAILLFWQLRRACYLEAKPESALRGSGLYAGIVILGIILFWQQGWVNSINAFLIMGGASLTASFVLAWSLGLFHKTSRIADSPIKIRVILKEHWTYGKWVVASAFVFWLVNMMYVPLVGLILDLENAGTLRALQNLMLPIQHTLTALGLLFLPWMAAKSFSEGRQFIRRVSMLSSAIVLLPATLFVAAISVVGPYLVTTLYNQPLYAEYVSLIPFLGIVAITNAASFGLTNAMKALEKSSAIFISQTVGALLSLSVGIYMVVQWGLRGAIAGQIISTSGYLITIYILWKSQFRV